MSKKSDPKASDFDKVLIQLMLNSRANLRPNLVKKLGTSIKSATDSKSEKIKTLKKSEAKWKKRCQRLEKRFQGKACQEFKNKGL